MDKFITLVLSTSEIVKEPLKSLAIDSKDDFTILIVGNSFLEKTLFFIMVKVPSSLVTFCPNMYSLNISVLFSDRL